MVKSFIKWMLAMLELLSLVEMVQEELGGGVPVF